MRRFCVAMFLAGAANGLPGALWIQRSSSARRGLGILCVLYLTVGLVNLVARPRRRLLETSVFAGIGMLSVMVSIADPLDLATFFYLWPMVYFAYYSTVRKTIGAYVWMAVTLAVALAVNPHIVSKAGVFSDTVMTVGLMTTLVAVMTKQQSSLRANLAVAAETDPLTGLLNRRSFDPLLDALIAEAVDLDRPLSVVMFDLDHFKRLNDSHGHQTGDRALQATAAVLREQSREYDLVSRFGGEEFAVALPSATTADARAYTERVAHALALLRIEDGLTVSTSAGISSLTAEREPAATLLARADDALYAAKEGGRCRQASWDGEIVVGPRFGPTIDLDVPRAPPAHSTPREIGLR